DPLLPADVPRRDDPDETAVEMPPPRASRRRPDHVRSGGGSLREARPRIRGRRGLGDHGRRARPAAVDVVGHVHTHRHPRSRVMERRMTWEVTEELVRAY